MIKYNLLCKKCKLTFDSWFASSKEYDKLKNKKLINCHMCGSLRVDKNLMAPKLINKTSSFKDEKNNFYKYQNINKTINDYQKFIKTNFEFLNQFFNWIFPIKFKIKSFTLLLCLIFSNWLSPLKEWDKILNLPLLLFNVCNFKFLFINNSIGHFGHEAGEFRVQRLGKIPLAIDSAWLWWRK